MHQRFYRYIIVILLGVILYQAVLLYPSRYIAAEWRKNAEGWQELTDKVLTKWTQCQEQDWTRATQGYNTRE